MVYLKALQTGSTCLSLRMTDLIESYSFGRMKVDGKSYAADLIIFPDHVYDRWWRKEGHKLSVDDLKDVWQAAPEVLIVGTGCYGLMKVPSEVKGQLSAKNVELIVENTKEAWQTYNRLAPVKKVVAALHVTC